MITDWIEAGLAAATSDECIVIVRESTEANLRWAINTLTTNGQMHHRSTTVVAIRRTDGVGHAGVLSGPVAERWCIWPLVVSMLIAQRRFSSVDSRTMTMHSSLVAAASPASIQSVIMRDLPRPGC